MLETVGGYLINKQEALEYISLKDKNSKLNKKITSLESDVKKLREDLKKAKALVEGVVNENL